MRRATMTKSIHVYLLSMLSVLQCRNSTPVSLLVSDDTLHN